MLHRLALQLKRCRLLSLHLKLVNVIQFSREHVVHKHMAILLPAGEEGIFSSHLFLVYTENQLFSYLALTLYNSKEITSNFLPLK